MRNEARRLTVEEAKSLLPKGKTIHVYCNPGGMLIGADWSRKDVLTELEGRPDSIEIGGSKCRRIGHGIVVHTNEGPWFFEQKKKKLDEFDPEGIEE